MRAELNLVQELIQSQTGLHDENMPGRCFVGDRNLQDFTEWEFCYEGKFCVFLL